VEDTDSGLLFVRRSSRSSSSAGSSLISCAESGGIACSSEKSRNLLDLLLFSVLLMY
jgi:hypothetical protein